jgi:ubiquinone/menaquinone biosynthesis C-methylase UbiE
LVAWLRVVKAFQRRFSKSPSATSHAPGTLDDIAPFSKLEMRTIMTELKQKTEQLIKSYNKLADTYDQETNTLFHHVTQYVTEKNLLTILPEEEDIHILDAGGGTGFWSYKLSKYGYNVTHHDISSESIKVASNKTTNESLNIRYVAGDIENTTFNNKEFDFVFAEGGVISYTPNPELMIKEINRIIKPDGLLWLDYVNIIGMLVEIQDLRRKYDIAENDEYLIQMSDWDYPMRLFSMKRIEYFLNKYNFKILNRFGKGILLNTLPIDKKYSKDYDLNYIEKIKKVELELSRDLNYIGSGLSCQLVCVKM